MAILSTLRRRISRVFSASQANDGDLDVDATQPEEEDPSNSNVANSITFVEGPDGELRTEGDSGVTEEGALQGPGSDIAAGKIKIENDSQESNTASLTFSQAIDDEEWARGLCGEEIEAAFIAPTRWIGSEFKQQSEVQKSLDAHAGGGPQGSSTSPARTSLKRGPEPDIQDRSERSLKRIRVTEESVLETKPSPIVPSTTSPTHSQDTHKAAYPFGLNVIADFPYLHDDPKIPWGIKWEFGRLASLRPVTASDVLLAELRGSHADIAPKLRQVIRDHSQKREGTTSDKPPPSAQPTRESAVTAPWKELDREDEAWERGSDEGIGLKTEDGWYGGKVQFSATLDWDSKKGFKVHLNAPTTGKSTHFGRAFHSRSCITMRITKTALKQPKLKPYLKACYRFFGRDFYVLDASTEKVTLVDATARRPNHDPLTERPEEGFGIQWMINYLNPMYLNQEQSVSKWRARFQLYFSDTVPGYRTVLGRVLEQDDYELPHDGDKCPAEKVLTDGCGRISLGALKSIRSTLKLDYSISAVQLRFFGAKGMALAMLPPPYEREEPGDIILRPSQIKIKMDDRYYTDEAKLTVDIVRPAKISTPARLSAESIQILSHNGVPTPVFLELQKRCFEEDFSALVDWPEDKPLVKLALAVAQTQNVVGTRRARLARGMARARGLTTKSWDELDEGPDEVEPEDQRSAAWWPDDVSGCPSSIAETCLVNLQAGFRPESLPYLKRKLRNLLDDTLSRYVDKFKITVPYALTGTLVPDPTGKLKPDEISISLSEPMEIDGKKTLILRNPAKQETDVRKVKIVNCPQLHGLRDVIVVSVMNKDRSLASRLAGGDYDGDKAQVILEEALVKPFRNAPTDTALQVPESVKNSFKSDNGSVANLLVEKQQNEAHFTTRLSDILLLPLNIYPGEYSIFHELAVYMHGLGHQEAIRVGYMFTEGLDGSKTGKSVKDDIQRADAQRYRRFGRVTWNRGRDYKKKADSSSHHNIAKHQISRDSNLGPFVMDKLRDAGEELHRMILQRFDDRIRRDTKWRSAQTEVVRQWACAGRLQLKQKESDNSQKEAIKALRFLIDAMDIDSSEVVRDIRPLDHWMQAISRAITQVVNRGSGSYAADLSEIYQAIVSIAEKHFAIVNKDAFSSLDIVSRQDALRRLSVEFAEAVRLDELLTPLSSTELAMLKASCAYSLSLNCVRVRGQFAFSVATRELCHLKAISGPCQTVSQEFIDGMSLHSGYVEDFE